MFHVKQKEKKMIKKILIIGTCDLCPKFSNEYCDWEERCTKLDREIPKVRGFFPIPEDCPLTDAPQETEGDES